VGVVVMSGLGQRISQEWSGVPVHRAGDGADCGV
jgi:hypothetical protein